MAWSRKSKKKAQRVVRRVKKDGSVVEYRYAAYTPRQVERDTIRSLVDAYQNSVEWRELGKSTRDHRATYLRHLAALGAVPLAAMKRRQIVEIYDALRGSIGPGSANGFLAAAKAMFAWAIQKDTIEHAPTLHVKPIPGGHWRAWTRQEADAAQAGLPEPLRRAVVLARHTGQRRADLCAMTWSAYDGTHIRLTQQKTKPGLEPVRLVIPATPALRAELDVWRPAASAVTILTNAHGLPWRPESLTQLLPIYLAKLGITGLNIHGLRKLAAAELANAGCSAHEIMAITGHKTLSMAELYTRSADQARLADAAVVRLDAYNKLTTYNSTRKA
jgi:integrase